MSLLLENKLNGASVIHSQHRHVSSYPTPLLIFYSQFQPCPSLQVHGKDISELEKEMKMRRQLPWAIDLWCSTISSPLGLKDI